MEGDGDLRSRASLLRTWGHYCYSAGRFTEASNAAAACRPVAAEAGDRYTESDALLIAALAGAHAGDPDVAASLAREAAVIGTALGSVRIPALARLAIARAEVRTGRPTAATRALRQARDAVERHGIRVMHGDLAETEAMLTLDRGQWAQVDSGAQALRAALRAVPMRLWTPLPALVRGRSLLGAARAEEAVAAFEEAVVGAREARADGALALAKAYAAQASLLAGRRVGRLPSHTSPIVEAEVAAVVAETAGVAALLRDDPRTAVEALDMAVEAVGGVRVDVVAGAGAVAAGDRAPCDRRSGSRGRFDRTVRASRWTRWGCRYANAKPSSARSPIGASAADAGATSTPARCSPSQGCRRLHDASTLLVSEDEARAALPAGGCRRARRGGRKGNP